MQMQLLRCSNKPTITASGGDTNIGVSIHKSKGSGQITLDALTVPAAALHHYLKVLYRR